MASYVSPELISAMGFEDTLVPERLIATFSGFTVFEVRGITITDELSRSVTGIAAGVNYRIGVSASVNSACRAIADDDFVDAEIEWMKEHQAQGPFALVQIGPTEAYEAEVTHIRRGADGSITTYDAFASSREEIRRLEQRALPRIAAALACAFNEQDRYVRLKKVARTTVGELQDGTTLHDVRLEFRGELSTSYAIGQEALQAKLETTTSLAQSLNDRVAKFLALGQSEEDQMKRFLYFFLALEIETHATFGRLDHGQELAALLHESAATPPTRSLLGTQLSGLKSLHDRFVWCSACSWTHLTTDDVALFKQLKQARDAIAHGNVSDPPAGYAKSAEQLAIRILSSRSG
nr:hypothetical protein [Pseudoxanthomonas sp.]